MFRMQELRRRNVSDDLGLEPDERSNGSFWASLKHFAIPSLQGATPETVARRVRVASDDTDDVFCIY